MGHIERTGSTAKLSIQGIEFDRERAHFDHDAHEEEIVLWRVAHERAEFFLHELDQTTMGRIQMRFDSVCEGLLCLSEKSPG